MVNSTIDFRSRGRGGGKGNAAMPKETVDTLHRHLTIVNLQYLDTASLGTSHRFITVQAKIAAISEVVSVLIQRIKEGEDVDLNDIKKQECAVPLRH